MDNNINNKTINKEIELKIINHLYKNNLISEELYDYLTNETLIELKKEKMI